MLILCAGKAGNVEKEVEMSTWVPYIVEGVIVAFVRAGNTRGVAWQFISAYFSGTTWLMITQ